VPEIKNQVTTCSSTSHRVLVWIITNAALWLNKNKLTGFTRNVTLWLMETQETKLCGLSNQIAGVANIPICILSGTRPCGRQKQATLGTKPHDRHVDEHGVRLRKVHQDNLICRELNNLGMPTEGMSALEQCLKGLLHSHQGAVIRLHG
jgi:hypothetical protein